MKNIIITGSSGYVAKHLIPLVFEENNLFCIDLKPSSYTNIVGNIADEESFKKIDFELTYIIINLAAARFDFGISPSKYFLQNVTDHQNFLKNLSKLKIEKFIHIGSVACFDGHLIEFNRNLSCDDSYRSTKFLQGKFIEDWCHKKNIEFVQLMPSAIYDDSPRGDTNIGKLQSIAKYIPFIPAINVKKSLTYMPNFTKFITFFLNNSKSGTFMTIERPVKTVTDILKNNSRKNILVIKIPFLKQFLYLISYIFLGIWKITKLDLKIYPNRVTKLFRDTSYQHVRNVDQDLYNSK